MRQIACYLSFLVLYCTHFSSEKPATTMELFPERNFGNIYKVLGSRQLDKSIQTLCYSKSNTGGVLPCDSNNTYPACLLSGDSIFKCKAKSFAPVSSLCIMPNYNQRYVVNCNDPSEYLCFSFDLKAKILEFCRSPLNKICLGERNTLQTCSAVRIKRQKSIFPELSLDGYYAMCEDCLIKLVMHIDEETNEQPFIEIKSQPLEVSEENGTELE